MNVFKAILKDFTIYFKPNTRAGVIRLVILVSVAGGLLLFLASQNGHKDSETTPLRGVEVKNVAELGNDSSLSLVGTVKAVDQATIQAEASGRVTRVNVQLGETVAAGTVLATIENSAQYASLLQAEGAYEAALANAAQTGFSVETSQEALSSAYNSANSAYRSGYITVENIMSGTIDSFFNGANSNSFDLSDDLWNKKLIEYALNDWQSRSSLGLNANNTESYLTEAESVTADAAVLVDIIFDEVLDNENGADATYLATSATYKASLTTARSSLESTKSALESARKNVTDAKSALVRSQAASQGGEVSATDAQVKQALGSLRSAQANYNKTILSTPVAGVVQLLNVDSGDYLSAGTVVAVVANENALEVTTYITKSESERIAIGDIVTLEGGAEGTVTAIAPGVNPATGKVAVKINSTSESLSNGDTVRLSVNSSSPELDINTPIVLPITALKVETDRTVVFTITSDNTLEAHNVETGVLLGSNIVITSGVSYDMNVVVDARGLNEGDSVTILN